ncbi:MAG: cytochrome c maturation protein CcmE [Roseovarius sp.]|nr:cytochrome c maturation protein CcmE [Roseovarius sp.]MCY4316449.1 cytochrome c maturation protein CcmE [Roseovarius sp.]
MKNIKKKRRVQIIFIAATALAASTALIGYALRDGISYYRSPSQVMSEPPSPTEMFRLGGLVVEGSVVRGEGESVRFSVTDGGEVVAVVYKGILPDLFGEKQGMIGTGTFEDGVFSATEILAKHDEEYIPKEVMDSLREQGVYKSAN